ncbi:MAG: DUF4266 domain-containing protein [Vicinamibacteria bacterium]
MKTRIRRLAASAIALALLGAASGCAHVKPWDRDLLARREMQFVTCAQLNGIDQHVYFSKEASMGGSGVAGGGCGCN